MPHGLAGLVGSLAGGANPPSPLLCVPSGVIPCQPGLVMPVLGSVITDLPSADTVAVPSITNLPVVWSNERKYVFSPGASPNTFGNVNCSGTVNVAAPGACI